MSTQEQRECFEEWATKANFDVKRYGISPGYQDTHTDDAWVAWLAAEAAAIERCAKVCNEVAEEFGPRDWQNASLQCSATIRALLPKE